MCIYTYYLLLGFEGQSTGSHLHTTHENLQPQPAQINGSAGVVNNGVSNQPENTIHIDFHVNQPETVTHVQPSIVNPAQPSKYNPITFWPCVKT